VKQSYDSLLHEAIAHHQKGEVTEAENCYRRILAKVPNHPDALHLMGLLAFQVDKFDAAKGLVKKAIQFSPRVGNYWNTLGEIYRGKRCWDDARGCYENAFRLDPSQWQALSNESLVLIEKGEFDIAIDKLNTARSIKDSDHSVLVNLSKAYLGEKKYSEAILALEEVVEGNAENWQAWTNLSVAHRRNGDRENAEQCIKKAISLNSRDADVLTAYGTTMVSYGKWKRAREAYNSILRRWPNNLDALINIASIHREFEEFETSISYYERALVIDPGHQVGLLGLMTAYEKTSQLVKAIILAEKATDLHPYVPELWSAYSKIERLMGNTERANEYLEKAASLDFKDEGAGYGRLFFHNYDDGLSPVEIRKAHEAWAERYAAQYYPTSPSLIAARKDTEERLRIGFVSGDWRRHPVAQFSENILHCLDREKYEIFCYSTLKIPVARTKELSLIPEHWRDIAFLDDDNFCQNVRDDRLHVLVDLQGHTSAGRLFAHARQPAPVQVTYLGYPNTTGLKTMQYRLTDGLADPVGMTEEYYVEELYRLNECAWCFTPWADTPPVADVPVKKNEYITFGSFNNFFKINDSIKQCWYAILKAVPNSRIFLKSKSFADSEVARILKKAFSDGGIDPSRVQCIGWAKGIENHLASYGEIDIALDTFPYHGTTTTCEALYQGVPVISLAGRTHVSRVGVSLLTNVGLADLIAESEEEYVAKAVELAGDRERLIALRKKLRPMMEASPLMDGPGFAKRFGEAMEHMYEMKCGET